jgi:hypothetical protein
MELVFDEVVLLPLGKFEISMRRSARSIKEGFASEALFPNGMKLVETRDADATPSTSPMLVNS